MPSKIKTASERADREIGVGRIAVTRDQVGIEDPLIEPAQKPDAADQPAERAAAVAPRGEIADQAERQQQQEADMNPAHHLARQIAERSDIELERGKGDADRIGEKPPRAGPEAFRKSMFEIVEFDFDEQLFVHALGLQHSSRPPPNVL